MVGTGKQGVWGCDLQTYFLCYDIYIVVEVDLIHSLRKFFICSMGAKRALGKEELRIEKEDTHLHGKKNQEIYGTEELQCKVIFRQFIILVS